jgi:hypothetical protein
VQIFWFSTSRQMGVLGTVAVKKKNNNNRAYSCGWCVNRRYVRKLGGSAGIISNWKPLHWRRTQPMGMGRRVHGAESCSSYDHFYFGI